MRVVWPILACALDVELHVPWSNVLDWLLRVPLHCREFLERETLEVPDE